MKLYDFWAPPNPKKVRMYLAEKGLQVPLEKVDFTKGEHRSPEFLAKNPLGLLPVLELDDGTVYSESMAIIEYFEELHPDPPMIGTTAEERMRVRGLERLCDVGVLTPVSRHLHNAHPFFAASRPQIPEVAEHGLKQTYANLQIIDEKIGDSPFVAGEAVTIADCTLYAGLLFPKTMQQALDLSPYQNVARWFAAMAERPSAKA